MAERSHSAHSALGEGWERYVRIYRYLRLSIRRIEPDSPTAYLFATILVAIATAMRFGLVPFGPDILPFVTYFPATLFAAFVGGFRPGLYAAALGGLIGWWGFIPPFYVFFPVSAGTATGLVAYAVTSLFIVWGADHHRVVIGKLRSEEAFRQMVVDELGHRLKNKVATIQSIVGYQLRDNPLLRDAIAQRLVALSGTDDLIMAAQGRGAAIDEIVSTELAPYDPARTYFEGPKVLLHPKLALSMALIIHELTTNAAKHGALSSASGRVAVRWQVSTESTDTIRLSVDWQESGGPIVSTPAVRGFGLRLLAVALEQFSGKVEPLFESTGLVCRMAVPLPVDARAAYEDPPEAARRGAPSAASLTPGHPFIGVKSR